jgi:hypothetical protein
MADADGSIFWYNQRWFDYTGTALENMIGIGWKSSSSRPFATRL